MVYNILNKNFLQLNVIRLKLYLKLVKELSGQMY